MHGYSREEFIGLPLAAYIHPDSQGNFTDSTQVVVSGGVIDSAAMHLHRDGSTFYVEVHRTAFTYQSRACILSILHDVNERIEAERLLLQEEEVRQQRTVHLAGHFARISFFLGAQTRPYSRPIAGNYQIHTRCPFCIGKLNAGGRGFARRATA